MKSPILEVTDIKVRYSGLPVLQGVSLTVNAGETVCVVGSNGAGKSTLLRAIMGSQRAFEGRIVFAGREIQRMRTEEIVRLGIVYVPEEKMLFRPLAVEENLLLGAYTLSDAQRIQENLDVDLRPLPAPKGTPPAACIDPFRRRAADGRHRPRPDVRPQDSHAGRAVPGPGAEAGGRGARHGRAPQEPGHDASCWWSRTCAKRSISPTGATCSRPAASSARARGRNCWRAISSGKPSWGSEPILFINERAPAPFAHGRVNR